VAETTSKALRPGSPYCWGDRRSIGGGKEEPNLGGGVETPDLKKRKSEISLGESEKGGREKRKRPGGGNWVYPEKGVGRKKMPLENGKGGGDNAQKKGINRLNLKRKNL